MASIELGSGPPCLEVRPGVPDILDWLIPALERLAWEALLSMKVHTPDTSRSAPASRPLLAPLEAVGVAADTSRLFPSIGSGQ